MNKYEKYKSTNIEWIGEIPEHWELKKLKFLAKILNGQDHKNVWDENGKFPIIGTGGEFGKANKFLHKGPSVILGRKGTIDKPQFMEMPFWSVDTAYYTNIHSSTNPKFFFYCCTTILFDLYKYGSAVPSMTQEVLNQIEFATPPLPEQTAIANYLDEKTQNIDNLISNKQQLIELLKEERTAIINEAVSGKGKNWEMKKLKFIAKKVQTGSTPPTNEEKYYSEEINWYTPSDFSENLSLQNSNKKIATSAVTDGVVKVFPANSVLFVGIGATLGKVGYITEDATANQQINCIAFESKEKAIFYANYFYANQPNIVSLANAATLAILNQAQMKEIMLPFPSSIIEFKKVNKHFQKETRRIDNIISTSEKEIELMHEYRTALISEVVTGKKRIA